MANKHRGEVEIVLDKKRTFRFESNSLAKLDGALGFPFTRINNENAGGEVIRAMVWAALLHELPELTLEEAGKLMDHRKYTFVLRKVFEAFSLALEDEDEEGVEKN
jgi:hypothetical protein